ncbi:hypothetical protein F4694_005477 [Bacillus niacini]|uniref:Uncharacterized protein n=1 Tax=Neobacillus niacini TaxID=86668 RepID=A0A852TNC5_9BACI|nr:hypothetical protein [Neobacillus niacini]NYE08628.1 hypothetical protein [Neobacillus niacini]
MNSEKYTNSNTLEANMMIKEHMIIFRQVQTLNEASLSFRNNSYPKREKANNTKGKIRMTELRLLEKDSGLNENSLTMTIATIQSRK